MQRGGAARLALGPAGASTLPTPHTPPRARPRHSDSHADDPGVSIKHMACKVTPAPGARDADAGAGDADADASGVEQVTFLYKLSEGSCPRSYGVNVARLAGLPEPIVRRAAAVSERIEAARQAAATAAAAGGECSAAPMEVDGVDAATAAATSAPAAAELLRAALAGAEGGDMEGVRAAWAQARRRLGVAL